MASPSISKEELRDQVAHWLPRRLETMFPSWSIEIFDTSRLTLSRFLFDHQLEERFSCSDAFDMRVDITGLLRRGERVELALAFCHRQVITLREVGPATFCSRLSTPCVSLLVSPAGVSSSLNLLLFAYNRVDLLEYAPGKRLKVATWDLRRKQVDPNSVIPSGELG